MAEHVFDLRAGVGYRFQFVADEDFEIRRPVTDEYHALVSEPHEGQVEIRGEITVPVDGVLTVVNFRRGMLEEVSPAVE